MPALTSLCRALSEAREHTDDLFRLVRPDSLYERSIPERHRIIFYLGHLEAFDWNLIARYALDKRPFHAEFDHLFAFGIDPPPGRLPADQPSDWPSIAEVDRYNQRTRDEIDELIPDVPEQLLHVALEHRLMHAETFAYILHHLDYKRKMGPATPPPVDGLPLEETRFISIPAGEATLGLDPDRAFGWDNEFGEHSVPVGAFAMAENKVTNGEYLAFVKEGAASPFFWVERAGRWMYRGMFSEYPLPLECPVYVTQAEAEAFARWRGKRLPTEPEFHRAASLAPAPDAAADNFDFRHWDPVPVARTGDSPARYPAQLTGNGWEWTSTPFAPFPGFAPFEFYKNYSEPFFDGQHFVLKGASPRTAACFARPSFRNWFRPQYPYIYSTFRLVEN
ncbi:MAG TPA: SUMF1/EgtB/PvdO family nonheme iron enzyme [Candidatus Sulfopaludibacter sp.]|jgi:formylglycine-generating enzyme required for sulfatase activity|nr:SUMF1/EgtB/PvdO family nonheme iron enzyme [Candidatus Sulfopaludibacter sp.]